MPTPDADDLVARLNRIQTLTDELAKCQRDALQQQHLAEKIYREILAAKQALKPFSVVRSEDELA
jgi:hypothetical protein